MQRIIGMHVKYYDYLGSERYGTVVAMEPYRDDPELLYLYIEDEEGEYNIHSAELCEFGHVIYAEIRVSNEVYPD